MVGFHISTAEPEFHERWKHEFIRDRYTLYQPGVLTVVGVHILLGLACTVTGAAAMLSQKRRGRHPRYGTIYYWCLAGVFLTAASLAAVRWAEDYHLFILGALSMAAAYLGRGARRYRWRSWVRLHITGMGASYVCS